MLYKSKSGLQRLLFIDLNQCESLKEIKELVDKRKNVTSIVNMIKKKRSVLICIQELCNKQTIEIKLGIQICY
jgi:DNA-binding transcriptional MerR regulator